MTVEQHLEELLKIFREMLIDAKVTNALLARSLSSSEEADKPLNPKKEPQNSAE